MKRKERAAAVCDAMGDSDRPDAVMEAALLEAETRGAIKALEAAGYTKYMNTNGCFNERHTIYVDLLLSEDED